MLTLVWMWNFEFQRENERLNFCHPEDKNALANRPHITSADISGEHLREKNCHSGDTFDHLAFTNAEEIFIHG